MKSVAKFGNYVGWSLVLAVCGCLVIREAWGLLIPPWASAQVFGYDLFQGSMIVLFGWLAWYSFTKLRVLKGLETMTKTNLERSQNNISYGTGVAGVSLLVTLVCSLGHYLGFTYWNLLDVALLAIGLWRIYTKQSILWMLILAADFIYTQCLRYQQGVSVNASTTFPAIFAYCWCRGLWGVFQYRHYKKAAPATAATAAALAPIPDY